MTNDCKEFNPKLKPYHIIIIGCLLSPLLLINSIYINKKRAEAKLNKEKGQLFERIVQGRRLDENTDKICQKGTETMLEFYKTGNASDLDERQIKSEDKGKPYFDAFLSIVQHFAGDDKKEDNDMNISPDGNNGISGGRRNLFEIPGIPVDLKGNLKTYGMHLLPILAFFVIAVLCIPGWLVCCFCCCCNCCCCCCCRESTCKIYCFFFSYFFYGLSITICVYGLIKINSLLAGMADTECSILLFFDQVLEGETKTELPKWIGINGINALLVNLANEMNKLKQLNK